MAKGSPAKKPKAIKHAVKVVSKPKAKKASTKPNATGKRKKEAPKPAAKAEATPAPDQLAKAFAKAKPRSVRPKTPEPPPPKEVVPVKAVTLNRKGKPRSYEDILLATLDKVITTDRQKPKKRKMPKSALTLGLERARLEAVTDVPEVVNRSLAHLVDTTAVASNNRYFLLEFLDPVSGVRGLYYTCYLRTEEGLVAMLQAKMRSERLWRIRDFGLQEKNLSDHMRMLIEQLPGLRISTSVRDSITRPALLKIAACHRCMIHGLDADSLWTAESHKIACPH